MTNINKIIYNLLLLPVQCTGNNHHTLYSVH